MLQTALEHSLKEVLQRLVKPLLHPAIPVRAQRSMIRKAYLASTPPAGCRFEHMTLGGIPVTRTRCEDSDPARAILYLHGGAYIIGSPDTHRGITGHLCVSSGASVYAADYRLAPEAPFPASLEDAKAAYLALLEDGYQPAQIALAGDSAGGGLALALAMQLRDEEVGLPGAIVVFSPWADLTHSQLYEPKVEPMLPQRWIDKAAGLYCVGESRKNPLISPVYGDFSGLPPLLIQVGSEEILLNDAQRVAEAARKSGTEVCLDIYNGLWHVFQMHAGQLARATEATREAGQFIRDRTFSRA
ncbi:MAG TPA: alpha/beta hydrolase [Marinobacter sp.]|jgi:acetyl esterase/lipase|uniref:alpha/beta hydrolase n=1 Tax=Marinobacter sp. TaxID=50741 RepID=UPI000EC09430|nr:alpha/beta hydrolase [Marinobacter sp.]MBC7191379.1 alpha/beta hydrolase [Marinobacter sp.]HCW88710.1 alpha/beta hydrolase [Marinobacter sp.]